MSAGDLLGEMAVQFTADISQLVTGTTKAKEEIASVTTAAKESNASGGGGGFSGLVGGVLDFGMKAANAVFMVKMLADSAISLGSALLAPDASMEQTVVAFTTLTKSAQGAHAMIAKLVKFAADTPFEEAGIESAGAKLLAFKFRASDVIPILTSIGDTMSALGKGTDANLNAIVDIFGKIRAAGKLTGGDMMQLSQWGIPAWQMLAQSMGKTVPELQKMVSAGLIPADIAIKGLTQGMEKAFGGGMAAQSRTFNGLMSTLHDNALLAWRAFSGSLFDTAKSGLEALGNIVASPAFKNFAVTMGNDLSGALKNIGSFVNSSVVPAFKDFDGILKQADFSSLVKDFKDLGDSFQTNIAPAFNGLAVILQGPLQIGLSKAGPLLGNFAQWFTSGLSSNIQDVSGFLKEMGTWLQTSVLPAIVTVIPHFQKFADLMTAQVAPAIGGILTNGGKLVKDFMKPWWDIIKNVTPDLIALSGKLTDILGPAFVTLSTDTKDATGALGDFVTKIEQHVMPDIDKLFASMKTKGSDGKSNWDIVWSAMSDEVTKQLSIMKGEVEIGWAGISGVLFVGLDILSGHWDKIWSDMSDSGTIAIQGFKDILKSNVHASIEDLKKQMKEVYPTLTGPWKDAADTILGILNQIDQWFGNTINMGEKLKNQNFGGGGGGQFGNPTPTIPAHHATGIINSSGGYAMVGEQGPELVRLPRGSNVYPNAASSGLSLHGGGGGQPVEIIVMLDSYLIGRATGTAMQKQIHVKTRVAH